MDKVLAGVSLAFGVGYLLLARFIPGTVYFDPIGPRIFPTIVALGIIGCGIGIVWEAYSSRRSENDDLSDEASELSSFSWREERQRNLPVLALSGLILAYALFLETAGYVVVTMALVLIVSSYLNRGKHLQNVLVAIPLTLIVYYGFTGFLRIRLPGGLLAPWL